MACLRITALLLLLTEFAYADIGIICSLKGEQEEVLRALQREEKIYKAGREFHKGILDGVKVVLVRSPMGKVNNAITAELLVSQFGIDVIVSIGFAGAVDDELKIGDVVIAADAVQHDFGTIKPYGFIWGKPPDIGKAGKINLKRWLETKKYHYGTICSGDQFISSEEKRDWMKKKFDAKAVDMGAAAIFEVCKQNGIPCLFIRVISDRADLEGRMHFNVWARNGNFKSIFTLREFLTMYAEKEM